MKVIIVVFLILAIKIPVLAISWLEKEEWISPDMQFFDCHSSSIVETTEGKFCVVWKGAAGKGKCNINMTENVGIWLSLFDGKNWSTPKEIVSAPTSVCWTPVLCKSPSGELLLFYRIGAHPRLSVSFLKRSFNGGMLWSKEEILPAGIAGPTRNKPYFTASESLISPSSVEVGSAEDFYKATACWLEISEDNGYHWKKIGPLELSKRKFGVIEPALFHDKQNRLCMLCRDRANRVQEKGYIWMAVSEDEGLNWSDFKQTLLPNPDSGIDVVDLGKGNLILIYNHSHTDRYPLNLAISLDGGESWSDPLMLNAQGEFPSAVFSSDGYIHITYAVAMDNHQQRRIKHIIVNPTELIKQAKFHSN